MNFEVLSFQMIYNIWWLLKYLIGKKDNEKKSAKRPTGGTVTVKGLKRFSLRTEELVTDKDLKTLDHDCLTLLFVLQEQIYFHNDILINA